MLLLCAVAIAVAHYVLACQHLCAYNFRSSFFGLFTKPFPHFIRLFFFQPDCLELNSAACKIRNVESKIRFLSGHTR